MLLESGFNFLWEDLLATRVDALATTSEQRDDIAFDHRKVTRNDVADPVVCGEGLGRLLVILVVAKRNRTGTRQLADDSGRTDIALLIEHGAVITNFELQVTRLFSLIHTGRR